MKNHKSKEVGVTPINGVGPSSDLKYSNANNHQVNLNALLMWSYLKSSTEMLGLVIAYLADLPNLVKYTFPIEKNHMWIIHKSLQAQSNFHIELV